MHATVAKAQRRFCTHLVYARERQCLSRRAWLVLNGLLHDVIGIYGGAVVALKSQIEKQHGHLRDVGVGVLRVSKYF